MPATAPPSSGVLVFDEGIPGFPNLREFELTEMVGDSAFQILQSVEDETMAMIVCSPWLFFPDYAPEITDTDEQDLDLKSSENAVVFCPVTIDVTGSASINLLGPFVVNAATQRGRQIVLVDSNYQVRTPLPIEVN